MSSVVSQFPERKATDPDRERAEQSMRLARMLIDSLPPDMRAQLGRELSQSALSNDAGVTDVIAEIIKFTPKNSEITAAALRKAVAERGVEAAPKEVYNSLSYLARAGRLTRIGYGRYIIDGAVIETSEDFGGERGPHEDLSDDGT